ncbi:MAG: GNAT family N-acetyltransferase [Anaerolineae bacterium]
MNVQFTLEKLPPAVEAQVETGHAKYEKDQDVAINYQHFALIAEDDGQVIGVLDGYTAYAEVYIDDLWVDDAFRNKGVASCLIQQLEAHFSDSLFDYICLCTSEFQAPGFYEKCGFELEFKRINERNPKFNKYFFIKSL